MTDNTDLATINDDMFSDARIEMVRNTVAKGAPADQFSAMIDIAKRRNLDPLARQISLIRFGSTWTMIVTIDGYRAIAAQTGEFAGKDAPVFTWPDALDQIEDKPNPAVFTVAGKRKPESCTVTVYKLIRGTPYPFSATVYFDEFDTGNNRWNTGPKGQLAKVAESHALRMAFPSVISGTYTEEEMEHVGPVEAASRVVDRATGEIQTAFNRESKMRELHAVGREAHMTHDHIHAAAIAKNESYTSTNDLSDDEMQSLIDAIRQQPDRVRAFAERRMTKTTAQEAIGATQGDESTEQEESPEPDGFEPSQGVIEIDPDFEADYRAKAEQYTNH